jgi:hypothetical protein
MMPSVRHEMLMSCRDATTNQARLVSSKRFTGPISEVGDAVGVEAGSVPTDWTLDDELDAAGADELEVLLPGGGVRAVSDGEEVPPVSGSALMPPAAEVSAPPVVASVGSLWVHAEKTNAMLKLIASKVFFIGFISFPFESCFDG